MHLNLIFLIHTAFALLFAFGLLIDPVFLAGFMGVPSGHMTGAAKDFARLYAVCLVSIAVVTWLARDSPSKYARGLAVKSMFLLQIVGLLVAFTLHYPTAKALSIFFYALFALLYLYILLFRQKDIEGPYPPP
jgi:FtsH-binding integral membrane protein